MNERKIVKMAEKDAERWLAAEMFYGEGAGTRRKLVRAEIDGNADTYDAEGYYDAFIRAYDRLDKNKFAKAAIRERKALDRSVTARKNLRALRTGNLNNLSTGVFIAVGVVWVAHETGYDKKAKAEAKKLWKKAKSEVQVYRGRRQMQNVTNIFGADSGA